MEYMYTPDSVLGCAIDRRKRGESQFQFYNCYC